MKLEKKVLTVFGLIIKPANWAIFISGIVLLLAAPVVGWAYRLGFGATAILTIQGLQLMVEGYGNVKQDEDEIQPK